MLRVMTWNIRTGGRDRDGTDRWDRILTVVAGQRPDVLALQELRGLDRGGRLADLAGRVGMVPTWPGPASGSRWRCWSARRCGYSGPAGYAVPSTTRPPGSRWSPRPGR
ncbi:endonuclease/exonuclease/phosphatase family protein [Micromonospora sp. NPDC003776]